MKRALFLAASACLFACPAFANDSQPARADLTRGASGFTYFNKPGATIEEHDRSVLHCVGVAHHMIQPPDQKVTIATGVIAGIPGVGVLEAAAAGGVGGAFQAAQQLKGVQANVENCMVVEGWRVVRLDPAKGEALKALQAPELHAKLAEMVGAAQPDGQIVRVFANDAASQQTIMYGLASSKDGPSLSRDALVADKATPHVAAAAARGVRLPRRPKTANPLEPLTREQIVKAGPDVALIVVRLRGNGHNQNETIAFMRAGADPDTPAWVADNRPDIFVAKFPEPGADGDARAPTEHSFTFAVPPGRWWLAGRGHRGFDVSFCLGAPSFDVKAGDVVYAGEIDLIGDIGPDMALEKAKARFTEELAPVGAKLQPAVYHNGPGGLCRGAYAYAFKIKDAPTEEPLPAPAQPPAPATEAKTGLQP